MRSLFSFAHCWVWFFFTLLSTLNLSSLSGFAQAQQLNDDPHLKLIEVSTRQPADDPYRETAKPFEHGSIVYFYRRTYYRIVVVARKYNGNNIAFSTSIVEWPKGDYYNSVSEVRQSSQGLISLKYGRSDGVFAEYQIFLLDPSNRSIKKVIPQKGVISYKDVVWSPDGKYIAYLSGGDLSGQPVRPGQKINLMVYDVAKESNTSVVSSPFLANSFAWGLNHDLYYAIPHEFQDGAKKSVQKEQKTGQGPPCLFQYNIEGGKAKLLFEDCYRPTISHDGRRVAFYGSEDPQDSLPLTPTWQKNADYLTLCVADISGTHRTPINSDKGIYPRVFWSKDDALVVTARTTSLGPAATFTLTKWDSRTGSRQGNIQLSVTDSFVPPDGPSEIIDRPEIFPRFVIQDATEDSLILSSVQLMGIEDEMMKSQTLVQSLVLQSGVAQVLGTAQANKEYVALSLQRVR